jgi:hypothetical protein
VQKSVPVSNLDWQFYNLFRGEKLMSRQLVILAAVAVAVFSTTLPTRSHSAPINISVDLDTNRTSGTVTGSPPFNTQTGFTSWDVTNVGTAGTMITIDGTTFELFGLAAANQSRGRDTGSGDAFDNLTRDFVFNEGASGRAVGLRVTGLDVGAYEMQSWHFDSVVMNVENFIQVETRDQGVAGSTITHVDMRPFGPTPANFQFNVTAAGQVKEIIFREDDIATATDATDQNRARLNGFTIRTIPEPGSLALVMAACMAACFRRGIRSN